MIGRTDILAQSGGHGCTCTEWGFRDSYTWTGIKTNWDANRTCQTLGSRKVVMLGDSTMGQTAATLMNALFPGGCQTQFTYAVVDTLVDMNMGALNRGGNWTHHVYKYKPDIVILTAGSHIYNRSNFQLVMNSVIEGTRALKTKMPHLEVVWKTQQPGGCTNEIAKEIKLFHEHERQWDEFYERDMYVLGVLPAHNIHVIDMRMLYYRSDAYVSSGQPGGKNCMHMCIRGPLDIIAYLFDELLGKL